MQPDLPPETPTTAREWGLYSSLILSLVFFISSAKDWNRVFCAKCQGDAFDIQKRYFFGEPEPTHDDHYVNMFIDAMVRRG